MKKTMRTDFMFGLKYTHEDQEGQLYLYSTIQPQGNSKCVDADNNFLCECEGTVKAYQKVYNFKH